VIFLAMTESSSYFIAVKIKTASRITFALPPQSVSPTLTNILDPAHPPSPQMPPTTTAASIETQTDQSSLSAGQEKQCQTSSSEVTNQIVQTDRSKIELVSVGIQCQPDLSSQQHIVCRDLTVCACVEQLVKTRQFIAETSTKLQLTPVSDQQRASETTSSSCFDR
jgi:hypothetical protein